MSLVLNINKLAFKSNPKPIKSLIQNLKLHKPHSKNQVIKSNPFIYP